MRSRTQPTTDRLSYSDRFARAAEQFGSFYGNDDAVDLEREARLAEIEAEHRGGRCDSDQ